MVRIADEGRLAFDGDFMEVTLALAGFAEVVCLSTQFAWTQILKVLVWN